MASTQQNSQDGAAARVLARFHATGHDERDPLIVFELAQIRHALKMEKELSKGSSYLTLFSTPGNRKRMRIIIALALFSQWSGNGLVSYYINLVLEGVGIEDTNTKAAINGGLQVRCSGKHGLQKSNARLPALQSHLGTHWCCPCR